jgi:hypothetical protein
MDTPPGDDALQQVFLSIRPIPRPIPPEELARRERDAAAVARRADADDPTPAELDRERRERWDAERAHPSGTLARRVAAFRQLTDPAYQKAERRRIDEILRGDDPEPERTSSSAAFALQTTADIDYHSLALNGIDPDLHDIDPVHRPLNKLAAATDSGLMLCTGIAMGPVRLHVEAATAEPDIELDDWETVVEVPLATPEGRIVFATLMGGAAPEANLATSGPGTYQVRVGNRGYDVAYDEVVEEPVEDVLVQVWPSPAPRTRVIKGG